MGSEKAPTDFVPNANERYKGKEGSEKANSCSAKDNETDTMD